MERVVSARTRRIVEQARACYSQVEHDELADDVVAEMDQECDISSDTSEVEDCLEIEDEENDEISGHDEEIFTDEVSDLYFSKDETFWFKDPLIRRQTRSSSLIRVPPGVPSDVQRDGSMVYFLKLFLSPDIIDVVVKYTNQKGASETEKFNAKTKGEKREWVDVDETEIYAYIGLLISSGATKSNREPVSVLWFEDYPFRRPIYGATMSRTRFSHISAYLRFDDMDTRQERSEDKLAPIREIVDMFTTNCQTKFNPGSHLTVDERLVPFRGHAPFRVYMKSKPAKYGMKIWVMADSETSYCKNLQVYLGKVGGRPEREQGKRVVLDLVRILGPGYGITTDNFFTSMDLAEELIDRKLTICGTLRKNKTCIPHEFLPSKTRPLHSSVFGFQGESTLVSFVTHPNKCVVLLSTEHHKGTITKNDPEMRPEIITHYNDTKGGVDTLDRMIAEYTCQRQTRRWPMALFMNIIDMAAVNAFVLWIQTHPDWKQSYLQRRRLFLFDLGKMLTAPLIKRRLDDPSVRDRLPKKTRESMVECLRSTPGEEINETDEDVETRQPPPNTGSRKRARCHLCPRSADKKVNTSCQSCKKHVCQHHKMTQVLCTRCKF